VSSPTRYIAESWQQQTSQLLIHVAHQGQEIMLFKHVQNTHKYNQQQLQAFTSSYGSSFTPM